MAHNLNENGGIASFAANAGEGRKNIAWHGLGQYFDRPMTVIEAIEASHANFQVSKGDLLHISPEMVNNIKQGLPINHVFSYQDIVQTHQCTYREDNSTVLGVVGSNYEVVQNAQGFDFIDKITGSGGEEALIPGACIETAGVLGNGERMFVTAKMPRNLRIGDTKDEITDYILFVNAHDGSNAVTALFTPVRVVCNNTLNLALRGGKNQVYFRHTKNVHNKLGMAQQVMGLHNAYVEMMGNTLVELSQKAMSDESIRNLVASVFVSEENMKLVNKNNGNFQTVDEITNATKNTINRLINTINTGVGQETHKGTALWVYNGFTSFYQNEQTYKDSGKKFDSIIEGNANKKAQKAFDLLVAL